MTSRILPIRQIPSQRHLTKPGRDMLERTCQLGNMAERTSPKRPLKHFLREWREKFKLTLAELAERLGTEEATVSRKETGKRKVTLDDLNWFAAALGVDPLDLLRHPDQPSDAELLRSVDEPTREVVVRMLRGVSTFSGP